MEALKDIRREKFCQIIALEDADGADAAFRAGYGANSHPTRDNYHTLVASRLLQREDVCLRINTIRQKNAEADKDFSKSLINNLKKIIAFDTAKYLKSSNVTLPNGRTVTDYYLSTPIENWKTEERALMCNGYDSSGRPRFIDKQWAYEKLLKIYNLDGKTPVDVEDIMNLFACAGLPIGKPIDGVSNNSKNPDLNSVSSSSVGELSVEDELAADLSDDE